MKRTIVVGGTILAVLVLVLQASALGGNARVTRMQSGHITIQSWLHASPSQTGLSGTVMACFKLLGAFSDQGGGPTWTDATYASSTIPPADQCSAPGPVGGFVFVPPSSGDLSTLYATHTITGQKGQIYITFAGTYDLVNTFQGSGTWVITGGTGAYNGVQGEGTWTADASAFPYIRHTEEGTMYRLSSS